MTLLDFTIFPLDKGDSVSSHVARCLDVIDRSGLPYRCHATGTTIEGDPGHRLLVGRPAGSHGGLGHR